MSIVKKYLSAIILIALTFSLFGCNNVEGVIDIIDEEQPALIFGSSTQVNQEDLLAYINDFDAKYTELNKQCLLSEYDKYEPITRDIVNESYCRICDSNIVMINNAFVNVIDLIEAGFDDNDNVMTNESIYIGSINLKIEFKEDALRITTYHEEGSFYSQHTLATIDDNIYYNYMYINDQDQYSKRVYYENHYLKYEYLSQNNYQFYQQNLETSEVIRIIIGFLTDRTSNYFTTFAIGNENYINIVNYIDSELNYIETQQLDGDNVEFKYRTNSENHKEILLNALELESWNLLKQDGNNQQLYKMYRDETLLYEDLTVRSFDAQEMPTIIIDVSENLSSIITIGETNFDLHAIILEHDIFEEDHVKLMTYYNISPDENTYEDYEDSFQDMIDYFDEYVNE
ncbi:hypothetical protein MPAN_006060 [Mariniplasma anaerobium]|uniref:Lipoprotein n=1 Tax=Mariniplasma anaerobium TaxID=2735436 RepID=A0A7U9TGU3_9MOLU|nr:hypothetical protein MPAN_006060 [Mariniplasma anaerobium]